MPASLAPVTPELFADFKGGKETALEKIFRANFEAFTKEANERLDDMAVAQKVAASAFLDVWDRRAKIQSAEQIESTLHQAVAGEASHELRRRSAAHHMGGNTAKAHDAAPAAAETTDQWWAKVVGVLQQAKTDSSELARKHAEQSRHDAAAHMKKVAQPQRKTGLFVVIGLIIIVGAGIPLWYFSKGAETTKAMQALGRDDAKIMHTKDGQRGTVMLDDSTVVRLGSSTTVKYPKSYPLDAHALQVLGAAVIKAPKSSSPLLVRVGNAWVYANNAEFIARSFADDSNSAMLKTLSGSVTVKFEKTEKELAAGSMMKVLANGTYMDLDAERAKLAFDWTDGNFVSENQPLRRVLLEIKRWYGIDIVPKDTSFLDRPVSMTAVLDSSKAAIKALEEGGAVKVTLISEGRASLVDAAATMPKPAKKRRK